MRRKSIKSIKLTSRITESKSPMQDIEFVEKKLNQGIDQATLVRQAINIYRKYEEGKLYKLSDILEENIKSKANNQEQDLIEKEDEKQGNSDEAVDEEQENNEGSVNKEQAKKLANSLDRKLEAGSFL
jgi:hypothetical protein